MLEILHNGMKYKNEFFKGIFLEGYECLVKPNMEYKSLYKCIEDNDPKIIYFSFFNFLDEKYIDFFDEIGELILYDSQYVYKPCLIMNNYDKAKGFLTEYNKKRHVFFEMKKLDEEFED